MKLVIVNFFPEKINFLTPQKLRFIYLSIRIYKCQQLQSSMCYISTNNNIGRNSHLMATVDQQKIEQYQIEHTFSFRILAFRGVKNTRRTIAKHPVEHKHKCVVGSLELLGKMN